MRLPRGWCGWRLLKLGLSGAQELAIEGEVNAIVGVEEIAEAQQTRKAARKLEKQGHQAGGRGR